MKNRQVVIYAIMMGFALLPALEAPARAAAFDLDAPGGMTQESDGSLEAKGRTGQPLVALIGDHQLTAGELHYDARKKLVQASGGVIWRNRRAKEAAEIAADRFLYDLTAKSLTAEGDVALSDRGLVMRAAILQGDLTREVYRAGGSPAVITMQEREIRAQQLVYERAAARLTAEGGVVLIDSGLTLTADSIQGDLANEVFLFTGSRAQAAMADDLLQAERLIYERGLKLLRAEEDVSLETRTNGGPRLMTAARLSYDLNGDAAAAEGGVTLASDGYRAAGDALLYDGKAETYTLTGSAVITGRAGKFSAQRLVWHPVGGRIEAYGQARFQNETFTGQSDELYYEAGADEIRLKGAVRLTRGGDSMTGEEIVYDLATGRVRVTGRAKAAIAGDPVP